MALDQEVMAVVVAGGRAARAATGDQVGVLVGLGLGRLLVGLDRRVVEVPVAGEDPGRVLERVVAVDDALQREAVGHDVRRAPAARVGVRDATEDLGDGHGRHHEDSRACGGSSQDSTHVPFPFLGLRAGRFLQRGAGLSGCRSVNNGAMHFDLPDDHRLLQQTVRDFAAQEVAPVAEELDRDEGASPTRSWPRWASSGGWASRSPRRSAARAARRCSTRSPSRSSRAWTRAWRSRCARTPRWAPSRSTCSAREEQKEALLPDLCAGAKLGAFGLTEPEAGSDAGNVAHPRRARGRRVGRSTAPSSSSPTPAPTSRATSPSPRGRATARSPTSSSRTARPATSRASPTARWAGTRRTRAR